MWCGVNRWAKTSSSDQAKYLLITNKFSDCNESHTNSFDWCLAKCGGCCSAAGCRQQTWHSEHREMCPIYPVTQSGNCRHQRPLLGLASAAGRIPRGGSAVIILLMVYFQCIQCNHIRYKCPRSKINTCLTKAKKTKGVNCK